MLPVRSLLRSLLHSPTRLLSGLRHPRLARQSAPNRKTPIGHRPRLEVLEDRWLPSAGTLDPTFGLGGKVTTDFGLRTSDQEGYGYAVARQDDGKIVAVGTYGDSYYPGAGGGLDFAVVRYNDDGTLDSSFGQNGRVTIDLDQDSEEEGKIKLSIEEKAEPAHAER